jgi:hypothetical protein
MELQVRVKRNYDSVNQSNGVCYIEDENCRILFAAISLERGWVNNRKKISCIPTGEYTMVKEWSNRFQTDLWEIYGVDGRSECKFHVANYWKDLNGCIALGNQLINIGSDHELDVLNSKATMNIFHEVLRPMNGKMVKLIIE